MTSTRICCDNSTVCYDMLLTLLWQHYCISRHAVDAVVTTALYITTCCWCCCDNSTVYHDMLLMLLWQQYCISRHVVDAVVTTVLYVTTCCWCCCDNSRSGICIVVEADRPAVSSCCSNLRHLVAEFPLLMPRTLSRNPSFPVEYTVKNKTIFSHVENSSNKSISSCWNMLNMAPFICILKIFLSKSFSPDVDNTVKNISLLPSHFVNTVTKNLSSHAEKKMF